jgi:ribosomal protein L7/L12
MDINTGSDADRINNLEMRVGQLEAALTQLHQQVSASFPPYGPPQPVAPAAPMSPSLGVNAPAGVATDWMNEVRSLKMSGQEIQAIKLYRQNTGVGLREAKDAVEGMG